MFAPPGARVLRTATSKFGSPSVGSAVTAKPMSGTAKIWFNPARAAMPLTMVSALRKSCGPKPPSKAALPA